MTPKNIALTLCTASLAPLLAHDLYVMPEFFRVRPGQHLTVELHNGDAFPESEGPPATERLRATRILGAKGSVDLKDFHEARKALVTSATMDAAGSGTLVITASLSANSRAYDAPKFQAYLEDEGLKMVAAYRKQHGEENQPVKELYSKYAKALVVNGASSVFATRPVGFVIEIVPAVDPATLQPGGSMPVQVLYEGKPMAGLTIETTWTTGAPAKPSVIGATDGSGRIAIPLQAGKCRITTGYSQRYRDQTVANWETFFATMTFEVTGAGR